jgi:phage terminase large subunit
VYYVTTTASTVGYGDNYARSPNEKMFVLVLQFISICIFSIIMGNITSLKKRKRIDRIIIEKVSYFPTYLPCV